MPTNSVNVSNNTGWTFDSPSASIYYMRLYNNGNLSVDAGKNMVFDEVTTSTIRLSPSTFYAGEFDEVTNPGVAMRYVNSSTVQIVGTFDETTTLT
jgi:hypothetical protein